jgi:hypothetical protein
MTPAAAVGFVFGILTRLFLRFMTCTRAGCSLTSLILTFVLHTTPQKFPLLQLGS